MKIIITEQQLNSIIEARSNPDTNVDPTFEETIELVLSKNSIQNTFVSFREEIGFASDMNVKNEYGTPTGMYCYPLWLFFQNKEDIIKIGEKAFRRQFPFASDREFMQFITIKNINGILDNNTTKEETNIYVNKLKRLHQNDNSIKKMCDAYLHNNYNSSYTDKIKNPAHLLWLLMYEIASYLVGGKSTNKASITNKLNTIYRQIGINGFIDNGSGYIHPFEPKQAVFFRVKNIADITTYKAPKVRYKYPKEVVNDEMLINIINKEGARLTELEISNILNVATDKNKLSKLIVEKKGNSLTYVEFVSIKHRIENIDIIFDDIIKTELFWNSDKSHEVINGMISLSNDGFDKSMRIVKLKGENIKRDEIYSVIKAIGSIFSNMQVAIVVNEIIKNKNKKLDDEEIGLIIASVYDNYGIAINIIKAKKETINIEIVKKIITYTLPESQKNRDNFIKIIDTILYYIPEKNSVVSIYAKKLMGVLGMEDMILSKYSDKLSPFDIISILDYSVDKKDTIQNFFLNRTKDIDEKYIEHILHTNRNKDEEFDDIAFNAIIKFKNGKLTNQEKHMLILKSPSPIQRYNQIGVIDFDEIIFTSEHRNPRQAESSNLVNIKDKISRAKNKLEYITILLKNYSKTNKFSNNILTKIAEDTNIMSSIGIEEAIRLIQKYYPNYTYQEEL